MSKTGSVLDLETTSVLVSQFYERMRLTITRPTYLFFGRALTLVFKREIRLVFEWEHPWSVTHTHVMGEMTDSRIF